METQCRDVDRAKAGQVFTADEADRTLGWSKITSSHKPAQHSAPKGLQVTARPRPKFYQLLMFEKKKKKVDKAVVNEELRIQIEKNNAQTAAYSECETEILSYLEDSEAKMKLERAEFLNKISSLEEQLRIQTENKNAQTEAYIKCEREILSYLEVVEAKLQAQVSIDQGYADEISKCESLIRLLMSLNTQLQETVDFLEVDKAVITEEMNDKISSLEEQLRIQIEKNNTQTRAYSECEKEMLCYLEVLESKLEVQPKTDQYCTNNEKGQLENYKQTIQDLKEQMRRQKEQDSAKILSLKSAYDLLQNNTLSFESQIMSSQESLENQMQLYELKMKDNAEEMQRLKNKISDGQRDNQSLKNLNIELQETVDFHEDEKVLLKEEVNDISCLEKQLRIQIEKNNEKEQLESYKQTIQDLKEQMRRQKEQDSAKILSLKSAYDLLQNNTLSFESQIMSNQESLENQMQLYELKERRGNAAAEKQNLRIPKRSPVSQESKQPAPPLPIRTSRRAQAAGDYKQEDQDPPLE
ncbi:hypothetical protein WMY93_012157 [Mugilogobius chulae]|uniref:Uncharacterized protein n=1 Tax=Mugilogobius chulae TaxID=88201 RepID=A0AAW0PFZ8_9GOBI